MADPHRAWIPVALPIFILALVPAAPAAAQASVTFTAESDYRLRGVSLTNGRPAARLGVAYDHRSGLYGGAAFVAGETASGGVSGLGGIGYAGYARRTAAGVTVDMGVSHTRITSDVVVPLEAAAAYGYPGASFDTFRYRADYTEAYAGLLRDNVSLHVYLSPNYLGHRSGGAYMDLSAAVRPVQRVRAFAHAGLLIPFERGPEPRLRSRADLRLGLAFELDRAELQVAWSTVTRRVEYPAGYPQARDAVVVSASAFF